MNDIIKLFSKSNQILLIFFIIIFVLIAFFIGRFFQKIKDSSLIKSSRQDAVKRSRAVISGQFSEQIAPFLPDFPCNPGDARFIGKPIDFIAFPGSSDGEKINEILIIEVKSGNSKLSSREKEIKDAIEHGKVRYIEYRIPSAITN